MTETITILGDGAMGTVCSILLTSGGHRATIWGAFENSIERLQQSRENEKLLPGVRLPASVRLTADDRGCFDGATMILAAIPTQYIRPSLERLAPHLPAGVPIVSVAKGIEIESLKRPSELIQQALGKKCNPVAVLSGPNIAAELARYQPAGAVVACEDPDLAQRVQAAMSTQWFRVYTTTDTIGVELAGALKNVIALAAGMVDGLRAGNNAKAALVTRGLVEITRLGVAMGARQETFMGLAGLGDLITTCTSPESRNRRVGEQLGKGRRIDDITAEMSSVAEGVPTAKAVRRLSREKLVEMPICEQVHQVLFDQKDVLSALSDLMTRELKSEV